VNSIAGMLDVRTLAVVIFVQGLIIAVPILWYAHWRSGTGALWNWGLTLLCVAGGAVVLVARGFIPVIASITLGNALILCACAFIVESAVALTNAPVAWSGRWAIVFVSVPILAAMYFVDQAIWPRAAYMGLAECLLIGQAALQIRKWRSNSLELRQLPTRLFEYLLWVIATVMLLRGMLFVVFRPEDISSARALVAIGVLVVAILFTIGTSLLVSQEIGAKEISIQNSSIRAATEGLANRDEFYLLLEKFLARGEPAGTLALLRILPVLKGVVLDPFEEEAVMRQAGSRVARFLEPTDVLARFSNSEFALIVSRRAPAAAKELLKRIIANLQSRSIAGIGSAMSCALAASRANPAAVMVSLRDGIDRAARRREPVVIADEPGGQGAH